MIDASVPDQGQHFLFAGGSWFFFGSTVVLGEDFLNERMRIGLSRVDHGMMATIGARGAGLFPPSASGFRQTAATAAPCTAFAAVRITSITSLGLESIRTGLLSTPQGGGPQPLAPGRPRSGCTGRGLFPP